MGRASPVVLVLAGWEPSGRVGLLADWTAISAFGGKPRGVVTAVTAQGRSTFRSEPVSPQELKSQIRSILERESIAAVKFGMIPNRGLLRAAASSLPRSVPWVVDPVVRTTTGRRLSTLQAADFLQLAARQVILTPNRNEARWLLGQPKLATEGDFERGAQQLLRLGYGAVIVKGGHARRGATDIVASGGKVARLRSKRLSSHRDQHRGTGCRFASATAVALARGRSIWAAAKIAKAYVRKYLQGKA